MIKIYEINITELREKKETLQDALNAYMKENDIMIKDIINIAYQNPYTASLIYIDWQE